MPGKVFVNYRREDARDMAARVRDRLAQTFGNANVFMDVDNLIAGQRFDRELDKALVQTDVFLTVVGPRWMETLRERQANGDRDYVREEIAGALKRGIVVIPVLVEQTALPRSDALPDDIRELVLHQKHVVSHEQFGRDVAGLVEAIRFARKPRREGPAFSPLRPTVIVAAALLVAGIAAAYMLGAPVPWTGESRDQQAAKAKEAEAIKLAADKAAQDARKSADLQRMALLKAQEDAKRAEQDALRPGRVFRDCPQCPEMVIVPAGSFVMGATYQEIDAFKRSGGAAYPGAEPQRTVTIARAFAVGKYEVTFAEWEACVSAGGCSGNKSDNGWGRGRRPLINVTWHDAKTYVAWLSRTTGKRYRLLSEAEWEYAARAGSSATYSWGNDVSFNRANCSSCGSQWDGKLTAPVGSFPANAFGLHDMLGNVTEWLEDCEHPDYRGAPVDGSAWTTSCKSTNWNIVRGGSWTYQPMSISTWSRDGTDASAATNFIGFRVAMTLGP